MSRVPGRIGQDRSMMQPLCRLISTEEIETQTFETRRTCHGHGDGGHDSVYLRMWQSGWVSAIAKTCLPISLLQRGSDI